MIETDNEVIIRIIPYEWYWDAYTIKTTESKIEIKTHEYKYHRNIDTIKAIHISEGTKIRGNIVDITPKTNFRLYQTRCYADTVFIYRKGKLPELF